MSLYRSTVVGAWLLACALAAVPAAAHNETASGFGQPGDARAAARTVTITLSDGMRFAPAALTATQGETVRLHLVNTGKLTHEFVLGTPAEIEEHAEMMRRMPDMVHTDASSVRLAPGQAADLVWRFSVRGEFVFACLLPGHREAGMTGRITVAPAAARP